MSTATLKKSLEVARAAERMGFLAPADWADIAVALLLEGVGDPEIAELAGFNAGVSAWTVLPLIEAVYERHGVPDTDVDDAVECLAGLMAADLRARPSLVSGPMIRLLARLAPPDFESSLANECYGLDEYLDCDCSGRVDSSFEEELERRIGPPLPDSLVKALAHSLRSTLPFARPLHAH